MTTNYHTPIATGATNAVSTVNTPPAALDYSALVDVQMSVRNVIQAIAYS